jgi:hypothetical protein
VRGRQDALRSPDLNAYAERFVSSNKSECLPKMVLLGEPAPASRGGSRCPLLDHRSSRPRKTRDAACMGTRRADGWPTTSNMGLKTCAAFLARHSGMSL